ncbi:Polyketide cyclase / dehydrase and lipid transport [Caballeronia hypogeia]|uniref:Polyketide cyclase / dehydrase and lipid transport n=1 Tax=Caballeronia hypogeia TaxID=1777140 RepID=A0A158CKD6_9BURK|nr:SRPBCC family protein [Caballeronia hypogeia]SAK82751.1 Polyketide cyclase / dehydrase and lipid transport [Caballeronia hypogeia]
MTTIVRECVLDTSAADAWAVLRDPLGAGRAFAGVLVDVRLDGDVRHVTFAGGNLVQERIVAIDDARMRIAYTVVGGRFSHHHASMQVVPAADDRCRFVWISDFLPDELRSFAEPLVDAGCAAIVRNLRR